ncbi:TIGR00730 family Rossman fold protein [Seongchinamella sediminis]|uniref:Cytokinin riboside 5'-monophosphate phosphoribohydrolase n=1 Tax=Seongchinamella sediminis TaxID=2283635 RepID=A0A3L7DY06_9GAMM|nr:TIGR00730 family Rossman fold protein [Seongchinamella sediminis]RLQ20871.1 TIGR00730 family Rossman fold protein [Seongchinamella sediminis]
MNRICVYCGASPGLKPEYLDATRNLAGAMVDRGIDLVYGGGSVGMMGAIADAVLEAGGEVIGVIPRALAEREVAHRGVTDLRVVESMHERKALMAELADGFIAMPGGFGTLEELLEVLTWSQLGFQQKPCGVLNVAGYFDMLTGFLDHAVEQQFVKPVHRRMLLVAADSEQLLARMADYKPPVVDKWIGRGET